LPTNRIKNEIRELYYNFLTDSDIVLIDKIHKYKDNDSLKGIYNEYEKDLEFKNIYLKDYEYFFKE
jgi:hypothetical protein